MYVISFVIFYLAFRRKNTAYEGIDEFFCPKPCKFGKFVVILYPILDYCGQTIKN